MKKFENSVTKLVTDVINNGDLIYGLIKDYFEYEEEEERSHMFVPSLGMNIQIKRKGSTLWPELNGGLMGTYVLVCKEVDGQHILQMDLRSQEKRNYSLCTTITRKLKVGCELISVAQYKLTEQTKPDMLHELHRSLVML